MYTGHSGISGSAGVMHAASITYTSHLQCLVVDIVTHNSSGVTSYDKHRMLGQ